MLSGDAKVNKGGGEFLLIGRSFCDLRNTVVVCWPSFNGPTCWQLSSSLAGLLHQTQDYGSGYVLPSL